MASAAQPQTQPARRSAPATKASVLGPKVFATFGVCVMLAVVVAITTSDESSQSSASPSPPTTVALQGASTLAQPQPQPAANPAPVAPAAIATPLSAFVAASPPPPQAPPIAQVPSQRPTQCELSQRRFYVAGTGIVRISAGDYVSEPVVLGPYPQTIAFPAARPAPGTVAVETIVVEGNAGTVVMTSDLPGFRRVLTGLHGSSSFTAKWASLSNC
jgi:hypothetical protein